MRPSGATWRSGYAAVCKTVYTSSILVVASSFQIKRLGGFLEVVPVAHKRPYGHRTDTAACVGAAIAGARLGGPAPRRLAF